MPEIRECPFCHTRGPITRRAKPLTDPDEDVRIAARNGLWAVAFQRRARMSIAECFNCHKTFDAGFPPEIRLANHLIAYASVVIADAMGSACAFGPYTPAAWLSTGIVAILAALGWWLAFITTRQTPLTPPKA